MIDLPAGGADSATKFTPISVFAPHWATPTVPAYHPPAGASIMGIKSPFCRLVLDGKKTWEIHGQPTKKENVRVYLFEVGGDGSILGSVLLKGNWGPLTKEDWVNNRQKHCIANAELPFGGHTHAYVLSYPQRFDKPQPCDAKGRVRYPYPPLHSTPLHSAPLD